jgi:hypothetical protein
MDIELTPEVLYFFDALATSPATKLYLETTTVSSKDVEDKYLELTGDVIVPTSGKYNIAPNEKWGTEGTLYFDSTIPVPDSLKLTPEKPGQINNRQLFWALVRLGFRVGKTQNTSLIQQMRR